MKTKTATTVIICCFFNQTADSRWKPIRQAYAATLSVALVDIYISEEIFKTLNEIKITNF